MHRFFAEPGQIGEKEIVITGADVNHIRNVLRMRTGEEVLIADGRGAEYRCKLTDLGENEVRAQILWKLDGNAELASAITLFQGLPKSDKMDLIVQKCVELGVDRIVPVSTKRAVVKLDAKKEQTRLKRWNTISESAAKQSGRGVIPEVSGVMSFEKALEEAKKLGATALFGEKYGDVVRVVNMGGYSVEFCGGTHLDNTAKVGPFEIESECSVASGVRRIEAFTGKLCLKKLEANRALLSEVSSRLKVKPLDLANRLQSHMDEIKELRRAIEQYRAKESAGEVDRFLFGAHEIKGLRVMTTVLPKADPARLRQMGDMLRDKEPNVVAVLASVKDDKPTFLAVCGKEAVKHGIKAGELVKLVCTACGGSGGGKPDSAMGGGKDLMKVDNALAMVDDFVNEKI
mgnify:CR=1 FL=1